MPLRRYREHLRKHSARLGAVVAVDMKIPKPHPQIEVVRCERQAAFEHRDTLVKAS
jgi:hypothetical protein